MESTIKIELITDLFIVLVDLDHGKSVTNNAYEVVVYLNKRVPIGPRKVYYRDTMGRFDELKVKNGKFVGFAPCTDSQQIKLSELIDGGDCLVCGEYDNPLQSGFCSECYNEN